MDEDVDVYTFEVKVNKKEHVGRVTLMDGTKIDVNMREDEQGITFRYPKSKFSPIMLMQIEDESRSMISIKYDNDEMEGMFRGLFQIMKVLKEDGDDNDG